MPLTNDAAVSGDEGDLVKENTLDKVSILFWIYYSSMTFVNINNRVMVMERMGKEMMMMREA